MSKFENSSLNRSRPGVRIRGNLDFPLIAQYTFHIASIMLGTGKS
jgi:hypothetical protein